MKPETDYPQKTAGKTLLPAKGIFVVLLAGLLSVPALFAQVEDDIYYNPYRDVSGEKQDTTPAENQRNAPDYSEGYEDADGNTYITNNYYQGSNNFEDDYYDYYYSSRIRRFHSPYYGFSYWHGVYSDLYWYDYSPFSWGISIYLGGPWWGYTYWPWWGRHHHYNNYCGGGYYDPWYYGLSYYNPYYSYQDGYHDGYHHGYWDGYYDSPGYNPVYYGDNGNGYYYGPRTGSSSSNSRSDNGRNGQGLGKTQGAGKMEGKTMDAYPVKDIRNYPVDARPDAKPYNPSEKSGYQKPADVTPGKTQDRMPSGKEIYKQQEKPVRKVPQVQPQYEKKVTPKTGTYTQPKMQQGHEYNKPREQAPVPRQEQQQKPQETPRSSNHEYQKGNAYQGSGKTSGSSYSGQSSGSTQTGKSSGNSSYNKPAYSGSHSGSSARTYSGSSSSQGRTYSSGSSSSSGRSYSGSSGHSSGGSYSRGSSSSGSGRGNPR